MNRNKLLSATTTAHISEYVKRFVGGFPLMFSTDARAAIGITIGYSMRVSINEKEKTHKVYSSFRSLQLFKINKNFGFIDENSTETSIHHHLISKPDMDSYKLVFPALAQIGRNKWDVVSKS
uniref:Uncharacterized protein n=1 Tax=Glossina austeni TaxID=7395 RepID=A0A1A9UHH7_GLOAU